MAYLGKEYKYERHEKFDEFLSALGVEKSAQDDITAGTSSQTLVKDGDTYTLTLKGQDGVQTINFKPGVEFDQKYGTSNAKTTFSVDGNTIIQTLKYPNGHILTYKKEFSDNKLVVAATNSEWNGVAYRYYSA